MSNKNWNSQTSNASGSTGGVKSNWSHRGTNSIPNATPKEKEKPVAIAKGEISGTVQGMGAKVVSTIGLVKTKVIGKLNGLRNR